MQSVESHSDQRQEKNELRVIIHCTMVPDVPTARRAAAEAAGISNCRAAYLGGGKVLQTIRQGRSGAVSRPPVSRVVGYVRGAARMRPHIDRRNSNVKGGLPACGKDLAASSRTFSYTGQTNSVFDMRVFLKDSLAAGLGAPDGSPPLSAVLSELKAPEKQQ